MSIRHFWKHGLILILVCCYAPCGVSRTDEITAVLDKTPNIENGKRIFPLCAACHLKTGWGKKDGSFPVIAGQHPFVIIKQLADIRDRNRQNPTMYPFSDPETIGGAQAIADVAAYIAQLPPDPSPGVGPGTHLDQGKAIYVQRCAQCHGKQGEGNNSAFIPRIKGQHYAYLFRQLKWFRNGYRKNGNPYMVKLVKSLKDDELQAVADYVSRLK